jgi:hypothetical protein
VGVGVEQSHVPAGEGAYSSADCALLLTDMYVDVLHRTPGRLCQPPMAHALQCRISRLCQLLCMQLASTMMVGSI